MFLIDFVLKEIWPDHFSLLKSSVENVPAFIPVWAYGAKQTAPWTSRAQVILHDLVCRTVSKIKGQWIPELESGWEKWQLLESSDREMPSKGRVLVFVVFLSPSPKQARKRKGAGGLVYFAYILIFVFKRLLRASTQWPQDPRQTLAIFKVMTTSSKPISEATQSMVLRGIIQQSIKTILLYETEWYSCISRNKETLSMSEAFMAHVLVFILT